MSINETAMAIVGGGIVGLATARCLLGRYPGLRLTVLEKESAVGLHQTGHNSGVIHSGLYYRPGSLKARTSVAGAASMAKFCTENNLPIKTLGKVVVATCEAELPALEQLHRRGIANGVPGIRRIGREELLEMEPHCRGVGALHLPGTAVTDYGAVARRLAELIVEMGGGIQVNRKVTGIRRRGAAIQLATTRGELEARYLINCAGLYSDRICRLAGVDPGVRIVPFRGEYWLMAPERRSLVRRLIYPVPDPAFPFLGVHFTPGVNGEVDVGPNAVLAFAREGYRRSSLNGGDLMSTFTYPGFWRLAGRYWRSGLEELYRSLNKKAYVRRARELLPALRETDLMPGGSGVRAQALDRKGNLVDDFRIVHAEKMVHVLNVPSPAATASLVIAKQITDTIAPQVESLESTRRGASASAG